MPRLAANDLLREIGKENPPQLVFLCGEDTLAVAETEKKILKKLTDGSALSDSAFDGQAVDLDRLADACTFCPMFQPYNVILIRDFDLNSLFPHAADRKKKSGCRVGRVNHQPDTPLRGNNYKLLIACERY